MYLLDSHILLWYLAADSKLSSPVKVIIDRKFGLNFSVASLWEIAIKLNIGKLSTESTYLEILEQIDFLKINILEITRDDLISYKNLPLNRDHKDPFDRILIAQSTNYSLTLITADPKFNSYSIEEFKLYLV
ncbi:MAG: type II toxin-antitoxin system VapC family toxin [Jaaginema sp. PMC 1079.18]|nr:type II toxin-antitoxin system VapC family toxin [Jaaginema sp. PMC 1080.18]MEC4849543.1 type II toxin-antitoxin system VapC family toxin [Jaaginema sp. PMC 1079.18]MEC4865735.1 type II toxin-antitoxin system VapC family toxin [Jaaginema sp. PMC 1078.18]